LLTIKNKKMIYKILYSDGSLSCKLGSSDLAYEVADNIGKSYIYKWPVAIVKITVK